MDSLKKIHQSRMDFFMNPVVRQTWWPHQLWDLQCRHGRTWYVTWYEILRYLQTNGRQKICT